MKYKAVQIKDGDSTEPVQYVGVYVLNWQKEWGIPEIGFVEDEPIDITEEEILDVVVENISNDRKVNAKSIAKAIFSKLKGDAI